MKMNSLRTSFAVMALAVQMSGRVLTPNGDSKNDRVAFTLSAAETNVPRALVYDVRGRRVAELSSNSPTQLSWDGKDYTGRVVESGVYLVQITEETSLWSGVIAVAK